MIFERDTTLSARWKPEGTHQLIFEMQDGTIPIPENRISRDWRKHGGKLGALFPAERPGYEYLGWFTSPFGGMRAGKGMIIESDITLYARWMDSVYTVINEIPPLTGTFQDKIVTVATLPLSPLFRKRQIKSRIFNTNQ